MSELDETIRYEEEMEPPERESTPTPCPPYREPEGPAGCGRDKRRNKTQGRRAGVPWGQGGASMEGPRNLPQAR